MAEWKYQQPDVHNGLWRGYIERSGLFLLVHSSYWTVNRIVIDAFIE